MKTQEETQEGVTLETYVHHLPGRLRVRLTRAKNNRPVAQALHQALRNIPGVLSVTVSVTTGSVLIHYDVVQINPNTLLQRLSVPAQSCMVRPAPRAISSTRNYPARQKLAVRVRRRITRAAVDYLMEKAFEKATVLLSAAIF